MKRYTEAKHKIQEKYNGVPIEVTANCTVAAYPNPNSATLPTVKTP